MLILVWPGTQAWAPGSGSGHVSMGEPGASLGLVFLVVSPEADVLALGNGDEQQRPASHMHVRSCAGHQAGSIAHFGFLERLCSKAPRGTCNLVPDGELQLRVEREFHAHVKISLHLVSGMYPQIGNDTRGDEVAPADEALALPRTADGPLWTGQLTGAAGPGPNLCTSAQGISVPNRREAGAPGGQTCAVTVECYLAIKRDEVLTRGRAWLSRGNMMRSEGGQGRLRHR